jgi:hypothetical protein
VAYNHARDPQLLAIDLAHLRALCEKHKQPLPPLSELRRAFRLSMNPRLLDGRTVNSRLFDYSVRCCVFELDAADVRPKKSEGVSRRTRGTLRPGRRARFASRRAPHARWAGCSQSSARPT